MSLDRRTFFKTLGVAGATMAVSNSLIATPNEKSTEFMGILYDPTSCLGCQVCGTVCAKKHGLTEPTGKPTIGEIKKTDEKHRTVINKYKTSQGELFVKKQCMHCNEPACAAACLTQAMYKTKEGPVIWRGDKCMGCRYCMISCPFDIPKFEYHSSNPKIVKCDMCYDKIQKGGIPECVENCPGEALIFGTRRNLIKEARKRIVEGKGTYQEEIFGEEAAGGTGVLYLLPVPSKELGFPTLQNKSYPELSKSFLYTVPTVFVLLPVFLLGLREATVRISEKEGAENE